MSLVDPELRFGPQEEEAAARLIELAFAEDFSNVGDLTCQALIDPELQGTVRVVARSQGVLSGGLIARWVCEQLSHDVVWTTHHQDGSLLHPGDVIATISGSVAALLMGERTALNFLTHLSGIATLTRRYVDEVAGTSAVILDTRKTHPGYRVLEKYAVRCGGGTNHRMGLYDGVLIKDNHLAAWQGTGSIADAVRVARSKSPPGVSLEVEVDTLPQLRDALEGGPDIVLLDNMDIATLREAVAIRHETAPAVRLEASGGVTLETLRSIAETGVERISVGALTHSAVALDIAFDWGR